MTALCLVDQPVRDLTDVTMAVRAISDATAAELLRWLGERCQTCAGPLVGRPGRLYCSTSCRHTANQRSMRERKGRTDCRAPTHLPTAPVVPLLVRLGVDPFSWRFAAEFGGTEEAARRLWIRLVTEEQPRVQFRMADKLALLFDRRLEELWPEQIGEWDWRLAQETFPMQEELDVDGKVADLVDGIGQEPDEGGEEGGVFEPLENFAEGEADSVPHVHEDSGAHVHPGGGEDHEHAEEEAAAR